MTTSRPRPLDNPWIRVPLQAAMFAAFGAVLFWPAGRLDWVLAWVYLGLVIAAVVSAGLVIRKVNPELLAWRRRIGKNTKSWDRAWLPAYRLLSLAILVIAGLDAGRSGSTSMSLWLWPKGLILFLLGYALSTWAMAVNVHFEGTVRIQNDRGHRVVDGGPYTHIRHPGYVGIILITLGTPLLLGSWWAALPAVAMVPLVALRTWLEDRTLHRELAGYPEFAARTRHRLLPGVW